MRIDIKQKLAIAVSEFKTAIGYNNEIRISEAYYPYDDLNGKNYPSNSSEAGCYVYAKGDGKIVYIGSSKEYIGRRIWAHLGRKRNKDEENDEYPNACNRIRENKPDIGVWAISVPSEHWWLSMALEGFLISKFQPERKRKI